MGKAAIEVAAAHRLVGRDGERARVGAFAKALPDGARALVIRGEPGIGKTVLWRVAVEDCRHAGFRVLVTRPTEEEMPLALVGLLDLFEDDEFDAAALRGEDDQVARGRAVLGALRRAAARAPTVVAIDDVQWLDASSARALRYALRRVGAAPVGVLTTAPAGSDLDDPLAAQRALPSSRYDALDLGPLGLSALRHVLSGTVATISRPMLRRIHEVSGGNPLYAIELARALADDDRAAHAAGELPLPDSLRAAIGHRLETVPAELAPLLETASALGPSSVRELREALGGAGFEGLLATAEQHVLLVVGDDLQVRFAHPLVASAVYERMIPLARYSIHRRLAELATDPDVRARHLALSTDDADAGVARLLEDAAGRASRRHTPELAADFARHSVRLTPPEDAEAMRRRALAEIVHLAAAGEASRARELADELVDRLPAGPARAEACIQRFYVESDDLEQGDAILTRALDDASDDELLRGRVLDILGWLRGMFRGELGRGIACAREALAIATRLGDAELLMLASAHLAHMETLAGAPRPELMARAVALAEEIGAPRLGGGPRAWLAKQVFWAGDLPAARGLFARVLEDDVRAGNELERPYRLYDMALVHCAAGDLTAADSVAREGIAAARDAENADAECWLLFPSALSEAWLGRSSEARATAERLLSWAERRGGLPWVVRARSTLGVLALSEADADAAARELSEAARLLDAMGFAHPGALPILPDAVEALALSGDLAAAESLLRLLERQAESLDTAWVRAAAARSRGAILVARGRGESALPLLRNAAESFDRLGHRPDAARAVLWCGRAYRLSRQRTSAAGAVADARARFAAMGARLWESRAAEELERVSPGAASGMLTTAERQVAALVAAGRRNREIGQALYMSVAAVEAHLTRIYRKLGIRSRSELAGLVGDGSVEVGEPRSA